MSQYTPTPFAPSYTAIYIYPPPLLHRFKCYRNITAKRHECLPYFITWTGNNTNNRNNNIIMNECNNKLYERCRNNIKFMELNF